MIALGQRHVAQIGDIAFGGEGVARLEGMVVFVPFVLTGEEVELEITEVKKQHARARLVRVLRAAPERTEPACVYFGECGGCQYQHVQYPTQLLLKHKQVADLIERIGGFPRHLVQPVIPCPQPYGYRNRLMLRSQWNKRIQGLHVGFLRAADRLVVDIESCAIAEPALNEELRRIRAKPPARGGLKMVLRLAPEDWEVPADSFFQNNFLLLPKLVGVVESCLKDCGSRHLVDAYCGVGFFALSLACAVDSFVGVEIDRPGIQAARRNATRRKILNGEFVLGATEDILPDLVRRFSADRTTVVLDPPRRGCAPSSLEQLRKLGPAQIIHISCYPATLARDLKLLCQDGVYELRQVVPLDMFPQTQHVECVADLRVCTDGGRGGATTSDAAPSTN